MKMNEYTKFSFNRDVQKKVMRIVDELKEIQTIPDNKKTEYALDRQDTLKKKLEYYLVPVSQRVQMTKRIMDAKYINYLSDNPDVVDVLIEKAGSTNRIESKETKYLLEKDINDN